MSARGCGCGTSGAEPLCLPVPYKAWGSSPRPSKPGRSSIQAIIPTSDSFPTNAFPRRPDTRMKFSHAATLASLVLIAGAILFHAHRSRKRAGLSAQSDEGALNLGDPTQMGGIASPYLPMTKEDLAVAQDEMMDLRILPLSPLEPPGHFGQPANGFSDEGTLTVEPEYSVVYDYNGRPVDHQAVSWYTIPVTEENGGDLKFPGFIAKTIGLGGMAVMLSAQNDVSYVGDHYSGLPYGMSGA